MSFAYGKMITKSELEAKFSNKTSRGIYVKKDDQKVERVDFIFINFDKIAYPNSVEGDCIHYCRSKNITDHRAMKNMCQDMLPIRALILKNNIHYEWIGYVHYTEDFNFIIKNGKHHRYILKLEAPEHHDIKKQCFENYATQNLTLPERKQLEHFWAECDRILALKNCSNSYDEISDLCKEVNESFLSQDTFCCSIMSKLKEMQSTTSYTRSESPTNSLDELSSNSSVDNVISSNLNLTTSNLSGTNIQTEENISSETNIQLEENQNQIFRTGRVRSQATLYNGLHFQSKNEALKANFMDIAEIEYLYEPSYESLINPYTNKIIDQKYSVDFFNRSQSIAIESKPFEPDETEKLKAMAYAHTYKTKCVILYGTKFVPPFCKDKKSDGVSYKEGIRGIMFKYIKKKNKVKTIHDVCWLYDEKKDKIFIGKKKGLDDKRWCHPKLIDIYNKVESSRNDTTKFIPV